MLSELEQLLALQDCDNRIRSFQLELNALPKEQRQKEKQIEDAAFRLETVRRRIKEIEIERKRLELEVQAKQSAIARYHQQQLQTRKNEEYVALGNEIALTQKAIAILEDSELTLMEEVEQLQPQFLEVEQHYILEKQKLESQIAELSTKKANLEARLADLQASRSHFCQDIQEDLLSIYERLFRSKAGAAIVPLEHDVCMGCHMKVPIHTAVDLKGNKHITHCTNCGRILYISP